MKILKNQAGYSITDLVVALPLSGILFILIILAMVNFLTTYQETKLFTQLQDELFYVIEIMRQGYTKKGITDNEGLIGLLTANNVSVGYSRRSITLKPVILSPGMEYKARFYLDNNNELKASGQYGIKIYDNEIIFPSGKKKIGHEPQFQILNNNIFSVIKGSSDDVFLLGIHLKAQVRFRERAQKQSREDDLRLNTRTIDYKTSVFIENAKYESQGNI